MNITDILAFAKTEGYVDAQPREPWNGYDVYLPLIGYDGPYTTGLPYVILVNGDEIRMSTVDETWKWMADCRLRHEHELVTA